MNRLLLLPHELSTTGCVRLEGRRAAHIRHVLKPQVGQQLRAGVVNGPKAVASVRAVGADSLQLEVTLCGAAPTPWLDLVLALPRPKVLTRTIEWAASFGVGRIDLINSWRVERSYFQSPRLKADALEQAALRGAEQGGSTVVPAVHVFRGFAEYLDSELAPRCHQGELAGLVAHPDAAITVEQASLSRAMWPQSAPSHPTASRPRLMLAVGPERGWITRELESWDALGFERVRLVQATLRVEAAVVAALAQLELARRMALIS